MAFNPYSGALPPLRILVILGTLLAVAPLMAAEQVELSDYFAVRMAGGTFNRRYQKLLARESKNDKFKVIGTTQPTNWDKPFSGPHLQELQASLWAVSSDGKTLLYWHQKVRSLGGPNKAEGIYRYRVGEGEALIYPDSTLTMFWSRYDKPLPRQIMVISGSVCTKEDRCALNADDGSLTPLAMYESSPLHLAAYSNDINRARTALNELRGIDDKNYWGFTALEIAIKKGHEEIALMLLGQGAKYRQDHRLDPSAIQLAVHLHRWQVLEALGKEIGDPSLLFYALTVPPAFDQFIADDTKDYKEKDLPRLVRMMLDAGLDPSKTPQPIKSWLLDDKQLRPIKVDWETLKPLLDRAARKYQPKGSQEKN